MLYYIRDAFPLISRVAGVPGPSVGFKRSTQEKTFEREKTPEQYTE